MYKFRTDSMGGSLGWIRWRNTIPGSVLPTWMLRFGTFWGTLAWGNPISEEAFQELIKISEEMGLYGERLPTRVDQPTQDLEYQNSGSLEPQNP